MPLLLRLALLVGIGLAAAPASAQPADWSDLTVYQVVTDRFFNAVSTNDNLGGTYDPSDGARTHGGDFQGLTAKLDYIQSLGVDAIWISPVLENAAGEYHGYAARNLSVIAPQMGGATGLQDFVAAAHARGLKVMIDIVANHMGDLIDSTDNNYPDYDPSGGYNLRWRQAGNTHDAPFDDLSLFHAHGHVQDFSAPEQELGELFGLDDLDTSNPVVRDALVDAYVELVDKTDCDAFRIDTIKHAELPFWEDFLPRLRAGIDALGKTDFLLFGEVFDGDPWKCGIYTGTQAGGSYLLDSVTWFPQTFAARWVFSGNGAPSDLDQTADDGLYDPTVLGQRGLFFDNHDIGRLASFGLANQDDTMLRLATVWLLTTRGMPILYYGTEQEFDGGGDPWNREDMDDGQWDFGPSEGESFNMTSSLFQLTRRLQDLRHDRPAFGGAQVDLWAESGGPGGMAWRRDDPVDPLDDVLIALNTATSPRTSSALATRWPAGTVVSDALHPGRSFAVDGGGTLELDLPARSAMVLVAEDVPSDLRVVRTWPRHDGELRLASRAATLTFDRPLDPSVVGEVTVAGVTGAVVTFDGDRTVSVRPAAGWPHNALVTLEVAATAQAVDGTTLGAAFSTRFRALSTTIGVSLAADLDAEEREPFGLKNPGALEVPPEGWITDPADALSPLVADRERGRVFRLSDRWHLPTHSADDELSDPVALEMADGDLLVASGGRIHRIDPAGNRTLIHDLLTPIADLGYAWSFAPPAIIATCPELDAVVGVSPTGGAWALSLGELGNPQGVAVAPPGHPQAGLVLVADPDIAGVGSGTIRSVAADGTLATVLSGPTVSGVMALEFIDRPGGFGLWNLYGADVLAESVLRLSPGAVTTIASGFHNLHGADILAFGRDDDLFVSDPGGAESGTNPGTGAARRVVRLVGAPSATAAPELPASVVLHPPHPNPANPAVQLAFTLPRATAARLTIHDTAGRRVATLLDGPAAAGETRATWRGRDDAGVEVASGVYHARLVTGGWTRVQKVVLVR